MVDQRGDADPREQRLAGDHGDDRRRERVLVGASVEPLSRDLLRRHVVEGADQCPRLCERGRAIDRLRDTEVEERRVLPP